MHKKILTIFALLMLLVSVAAAQNSPQDFPMVHDEAKLMTTQQQQDLEQKLRELNAKYNIKVAVLTMKKVPGAKEVNEIREYGKAFLFQHYRDLENNNGSVIFFQVTSSRDFMVITDNNMRLRITDGEGYPYLEERFLEHLKDGNYYQAYSEYADGVDYLCAYYEENDGEPYSPFNEFSWTGLIGGILLSGCLGYGFYGFLVSRMSNVAFKFEAGEYLNKDSFNLTHSEDNFLYTSRTVVQHKSKDDDSSSSSSSSYSDSDSGGGGGKY